MVEFLGAGIRDYVIAVAKDVTIFLKIVAVVHIVQIFLLVPVVTSV